MASLRSFQNEIDQIQHRETLKQRIQAKAEQERARDVKKAPVKSPTKAVAVDTNPATKGEHDKSKEAKRVVAKSLTKGTTKETQDSLPVPAITDVAGEQESDEPIDQDKMQASTSPRMRETSAHATGYRSYCCPIR